MMTVDFTDVLLGEDKQTVKDIILEESYVPDAPVDTEYYARKDAAWTLLAASVPEAPIDGETYARKDAAWVLMDIGGVVTLSNLATFTLDMEAGNYFELTLNQNASIVTTNTAKGDVGIITVIQSVGGHAVTFDGTFYPPAGTQPTLNTDAGAVNVFKYTCVDNAMTILEYVADHS